jgi:hypothetical protein
MVGDDHVGHEVPKGALELLPARDAVDGDVRVGFAKLATQELGVGRDVFEEEDADAHLRILALRQPGR